MADSADVIKEFLVQLGFKVDPGSERRFVDSIGAATVKAVALGTAITATAGAVVAGVARIADNLEQLYFASRRTNASVENLQATGFAARQMGVDAGAALGSIEALARFLRNSPGGEGLLKNLGVNTRDARGAMRDTVDLMGDLGKKFASMPYYKAHAFAQALGIDEKTLMAMREGMGEFQDQYKAMLHAAGVDSQAAAKSSHAFMSELRLFGGAFAVLTQKIVSNLTGPLGVGIRRAREGLVSNFDRIAAVVGGVMDKIVRVTDAVIGLAVRGGQAVGWLVDWFRGLTPATQGAIEGVGALLLAWKALNMGILATPLGQVLALGAAILALADDYMTWKEGGKSLIDWSEWAPGIEEALANLKVLGAALGELGGVLGKILEPALRSVGRILADVVKTGFGNLLDMVTLITDVLTGKWDQAGAHARAMLARTAAFAKAAFSTALDGAVGTAANLGASMAGNTAPKAAPAIPAASRASSSDPRGIRNFNPGNIEYSKWARDHGATGKEAQGRFATFGDAQAGLDALAALLRSYMARGIDSVRAIVTKYAPPGENNTEAYVLSVAKRLGVDANAHLDARNAAQMAGLVDSIVRVENGKNPYSREMIAHAAAGGGKPVEIHQTTTIHVAGNDAKGIASDVARAQNDVNGQLVRNTRGAILQ